MVNFNPATFDILEGHRISEYHPAVPLFISDRVFKPTKKSNMQKLSTIAVDCRSICEVKLIIQFKLVDYFKCIVTDYIL